MYLDVNECLRADACSKNSVCVNVPNSFYCTCRDGYTGIGTACEGKSSMICLFLIAIVKIVYACEDINECLSHKCSRNEVCRNTEGSYRCDCQAGFARDGSKCDGNPLLLCSLR